MSNAMRTPWTLGTHDPRVVYNAHGDEAVTVHGHYDDAVPVANLVAAAPDLLKLLERIDNLLAEWKNLNYINYGKMKTRFDEDLEQIELQIEEAIAAAKGEA